MLTASKEVAGQSLVAHHTAAKSMPARSHSLISTVLHSNWVTPCSQPTTSHQVTSLRPHLEEVEELVHHILAREQAL